nr:MAG TPA: hypothetical protein [Caudoviricetes sp.]
MQSTQTFSVFCCLDLLPNSCIMQSNRTPHTSQRCVPGETFFYKNG